MKKMLALLLAAVMVLSMLPLRRRPRLTRPLPQKIPRRPKPLKPTKPPRLPQRKRPLPSPKI